MIGRHRASTPCPRCAGCKWVANTDDQEPWTLWQALPPGPDLAVRLGLVRPVACQACDGTGVRSDPR